jgi:hypothetical protein
LRFHIHVVKKICCVCHSCDDGACAESKVQIVLTAEGFIFQPEKKVLLTPGLLAQIDADGSGTISTEELDEAVRASFPIASLIMNRILESCRLKYWSMTAA